MMGSSSHYYSSKFNCKVPTNLKGSVLNVILRDMGMMRMMGGTAPKGAHMQLVVSPNKTSVGVVSIFVENLGWRIHELVILPLSTNQRVGQRIPGSVGKIRELRSIAEASNNCGSGTGSGIRSGSASWITLNLKAGRYELVCNLANHYADGMYQELDADLIV